MKKNKVKKLPSIRELFSKGKLLCRRAGLDELKALRWQNFLLLICAGCVNAIGVTMFLY